MTRSKTLIRVEMTYDNGTREWLEGDAAQRWANGANACISTAYFRGVTMPDDLPWQTSTEALPNLAMDPATAQRLRKVLGQIDPQEEDRCNAQDQMLRDFARAVGMSPLDTREAVVARIADVYQTLVRLLPAVAAFEAAAKGLPSHVHVRPVCATTSCDNLPKRGNLCNRCYEQKEGG